MSHILEERGALLGVVAELMTQDAECARAVIESPCDHVRRLLLYVEGPECFVLPLQGFFGSKKEASLRGLCYLITRIDRHGNIMLHSMPKCQYLVAGA